MLNASKRWPTSADADAHADANADARAPVVSAASACEAATSCSAEHKSLKTMTKMMTLEQEAFLRRSWRCMLEAFGMNAHTKSFAVGVSMVDMILHVRGPMTADEGEDLRDFFRMRGAEALALAAEA